MIKAVIFDLGNVIVPFDPQRRVREFATVCCYTTAEISSRVAASGLTERFEMGQVSPQEFYHGICGTLDLEVSYSEFCRIWSSIFLPGTLVPESWLEGLHLRYRLLALSDTDPIHFSAIEKNYPIIRHFDTCILSFEVGARKPSSRIFHEAITRAGFPASQCLFTDDSAANVEAARNAGMDAVQFRSLPQLEADFRAHGIEWE